MGSQGGESQSSEEPSESTLKLLEERESEGKALAVQTVKNGKPPICILSVEDVLELSHCDMYRAPAFLRASEHLKRLVLTNISLKEIPTCLYTGLEEVEELDLSHNELENFDVHPACRRALRHLNLSHNSLRTVPQWILKGMAPQLTDFIYSFNDVKTLRTKAALQLRHVEMVDCNLVHQDFVFFRKLKRLRYLDIGIAGKKTENYFSDPHKLLDSRAGPPLWEGLEVLRLDNISLSVLPRDLFWIGSLRELHLANSDLSWIPDDIGYLQHLEVLDVTRNKTCGLPVTLLKLKKLRVIKAARNLLDCLDSWREVAEEEAPKLEVLDLYDNRLEGLPESVFRCCESIDLELNCFNTRTLDWYTPYAQKKDGYRATEHCCQPERVDGPRPPSEETAIGDTAANEDRDSESEESAQEILYTSAGADDAEEEDWDNDESQTADSGTRESRDRPPRHPQITESDDEWLGVEEPVKRRRRKKIIYITIDPDENWVFCDVE